MKRLNEIIECNYSIEIKNIKTDSRKIQPNDLFVATKGYHIDRHLFIEDAIKNGAVAIIGEQDIECSIPYIKVKNSYKTLLKILSKFYNNLEKKFKFIGITGTDGKTTTAYITSQIINAAYIGTNGVIYKENSWSTNNTTPEICELYEYLKRLKKLNCNTIVMEVSSEALLHKRVDNINFDIAAITNITEDHLNIHKTLDNYIKDKIKLFTLVPKNGIAILNLDDQYYKNVEIKCKTSIYTYGQNKNSNFKILNINNTEKTLSFIIKHNNQKYYLKSPLHGEYNAYNLTLAFVISKQMGMSPSNIIKKIKQISFVSGRFEMLNFGQNYKIILDYAHTYNGILNIISSSKKLKHNKIIVITGAAGGREHEKRAAIGKYILENTDHTIFTMDDPRYENVEFIINDLVSKTAKKNYERIIDRRKAINKALCIAKKDDIVLIIGKGRDNYMAIENQNIPYCDYDVIKDFFSKEK